MSLEAESRRKDLWDADPMDVSGIAVANTFGAANQKDDKKFQAIFDYGVLGAFYSSGVSMGSTVHAESIRGSAEYKAFEGSQITPPWEQRQIADGDILNRIFTSKPLIDLEADDLQGEELGDDNRKLFALYKGMLRLQELVDFATVDSRAETMRPLLDQQFQNYYAELQSFVEDNPLLDIDLIFGMSNASTDANIKRPATPTSFLASVISTVRTDPIPGLTGSETFTISVTENGTTTDVAVDLSGITGTLDIDTVVDHINTQLAAATDVATRFKTTRLNEFQYAIEIDKIIGEDLSFSTTDTAEPAVYVAGGSGSGIFGNGFVVKVDDLSAAAPTQAWYRGISTGAEDEDTAGAVATDSNGNVYVVGSTVGDLDDQVNGGTQDAYLQKYDAAGNLIWTQLLGSADTAKGVSVTVDSGDNIIIAGQTTARLTDTAAGGNGDAFVTKFDSTGQELWTRQVAPYADDGAVSVTVDASDNIFLTGFAASAIADGLTHGGGRDAFVTKLDSSGTLAYNKQFGGTGDETPSAITVDNSGSLFVAYDDGTNAYVRKYTDSATNDPAVWEVDLGALGNGQVGGLAIDTTGEIYVTGYSDNAALNGTVATAHSGGIDGFVTRITDSGASAAIDWLSYVGSSGTDQALDVAVNGGNVYLTGNTDGTIGSATQVGDQDGFVAKLDNTGALTWAHQFGGGFSHSGAAINFDAGGTSVLSLLGLPNGEIPGTIATTAVSQSTVRGGQSFGIKVDGGTTQTITIGDTDSFGWIAFQINKVLGNAGQARYLTADNSTLLPKPTEEYLTIEALDGATIELVAGPDGFDALPGLGLSPKILRGEFIDADKQAEFEQTFFEMGMVDTLDLLSQKSSSDARDVIDNAMRVIRKAYDMLNFGPQEDDPLLSAGPPPAYLAEKIAAYEDALNQVQNGLLGTGIPFVT